MKLVDLVRTARAQTSQIATADFRAVTVDDGAGGQRVLDRIELAHYSAELRTMGLMASAQPFGIPYASHVKGGRCCPVCQKTVRDYQKHYASAHG
jgi:hypothetical protein